VQVIGNCLECPFHGWQYDGETGHCTKIPYSKGKIPSQAKVKVWPSIEANGVILVWYDAEGRDPGWFPEQFEKIKSGRWVYHGYSTHLINSHIEVSVHEKCV
jgi:cholesterol 7-dehydrogenase